MKFKKTDSDEAKCASGVRGGLAAYDCSTFESSCSGFSAPRPPKPCPFCGGSSVTFDSGRRYRVECLHCGSRSAECSTRIEAERSWNTRVSAECNKDDFPPLSISATVFAGADINSALVKAKQLAQSLGCGIDLTFNGHLFSVYPDTDIAEWFRRIHDVE